NAPQSLQLAPSAGSRSKHCACPILYCPVEFVTSLEIVSTNERGPATILQIYLDDTCSALPLDPGADTANIFFIDSEFAHRSAQIHFRIRDLDAPPHRRIVDYGKR